MKLRIQAIRGTDPQRWPTEYREAKEAAQRAADNLDSVERRVAARRGVLTRMRRTNGDTDKAEAMLESELIELNFARALHDSYAQTVYDVWTELNKVGHEEDE